MGARRLTSVVFVSLCALTCVALYCGAPAWAARGHVFSGSFGGQGSGDGQLDEPSGVAVNDSTHNVYVVDKGNDRVEELSSTGSYVGQFNGSGTLAGEGSAAPTGQLSAPTSIAVDNSTNTLTDPSAGDVYVVDTGHQVIDKFSSTGAYIGQLTEGSPGSAFFDLQGVAVDQNGTLWVDYLGREIDSFSDSVANEFLSVREAQVGGYPGFAVDSEDNLYVDWDGAKSTIIAAKLNSAGSIIKEEIDREEATTAVAVNLSNNDLYIDNASSIGLFSPEGKLIERFGPGSLKEGTGITIDPSNGNVYVVDAIADTVDIFGLEPYSSPVVESESASDVASTSATLNAQINPRGSSTEYRFEYGPSTSYGMSAPVPDGFIASDFGATGISIHRPELLARTTYHYRVVAHNELGTVDGLDHTFTTQPAGGEELVLPDGRAWELVSPPDKKGVVIEPGIDGDRQAALDGDGITYVASEPIGEGEVARFALNQIVSTRGVGGWRSQAVSVRQGLPPEGEQVGVELLGSGEINDVFSPDLSADLIEPFGTPPQAPGETERTLYLRDSTNGALLALETPADVSSGKRFGDQNMKFLAATPDLNHVIFGTTAALTPEAVEPPPKGSGVELRNLYEWSAGRLQLVNVTPEGTTRPGALLGSYAMSARAVSGDGRWVVWNYGEPAGSSEVSLYARDMVGDKTVQIGGKYPRFETMSSDGSKIFYVETEPGQEGRGGDLHVFDTSNDTQTDLTANHGAGEPSAGVKEAVMGASEDGSYVYFVAAGVLAEGATSGADNMYVLHDTGSEWTTTFIATLSGEDEKTWGAQKTIGAVLSRVSSRVSPNGRYVAFMSDRSLTGYDNLDALSGQPDEEVYLYDALAGHLVCASCDPTGARPVGVFDDATDQSSLLVDRTRVWSASEGSSNHWLAGSLPGWDETSYVASYQPRYLSDSGRLFFDSPDALVPQDTNGLEDVYEYEPPASSGTAGSDDCTTGSVTFSERSGGCVSLISSGTSGGESAFMDASENGNDVFFVTASKLTGEDYDTAYDLYDAHVCSTEVSCRVLPVSPPACTSGDSCKAAPSPQPVIFGAAPSATFSGTGNVVEEAKGTVKSKKHVVKRKTKAKRRVKKDRNAKKRKANKSSGRKARRSRTGKASRKGDR
jgi:hypothetical protein